MSPQKRIDLPRELSQWARFGGSLARLGGIATLSLLLVFDAVPTFADTSPQTVGATPPRLSLVEGEVSFWRPGSEDWAPAQRNIALAPGDALYTGSDGRLELQIGGRAFVRAAASTQISLASREPDYVQLDLRSGRAALDLRELQPGHNVEIDTPNAAMTVAQPGYYDVEVGDSNSTFVARRGGRATLVPANGSATPLRAGDRIVIEGTDNPALASYAAPALDAWDRWNYERTDAILAGERKGYLPPDVYGEEDLDRYGTWETAPDYGRIWVPRSVPVGWAPYSDGQWMWDAYYGWTWVDNAPWGWAPCHYGRWVYYRNYWAWAPGPVVVAPAYAPALVAFFDVGPVHVGVGVPAVGWVALGWGEPVIPWWGRPAFRGRPWWGGWGGPRVVNNVVISRTKIVRVNDITVYRNAHRPHGIIALRRGGFGRGEIERLRLAHIDPKELRPVRGPLPFKPKPVDLSPAGHGPARRGLRPPAPVLSRRVVAMRAPENPARRLADAGLRVPQAERLRPPRLVGPRPETMRPAEVPREKMRMHPSEPGVGVPQGSPPQAAPAPRQRSAERRTGVAPPPQRPAKQPPRGEVKQGERVRQAPPPAEHPQTAPARRERTTEGSRSAAPPPAGRERGGAESPKVRPERPRPQPRQPETMDRGASPPEGSGSRREAAPPPRTDAERSRAPERPVEAPPPPRVEGQRAPRRERPQARQRPAPQPRVRPPSSEKGSSPGRSQERQSPSSRRDQPPIRMRSSARPLP